MTRYGMVIDLKKCFGCHTCATSCLAACPYNVRRFNEGEPVWTVDFPTGFATAPTHVANTMGKCQFCKNLVDEGKNPMCVDACIGYARTPGDLDDPNSDVAKLLAEREYEQFMAEQNTNPNVYCLV